MAIRHFSSILAGVALVALAGCDMLGGNNSEASEKGEPLALVDANAGGKPAAAAVAPDFGDDNGSYAKDGECDDMRFEGPGMTSTPLLDEDIKHDATDCRVAFQQGRLALRR